MSGYIVTILSSVLLGFTVAIDKLMMGDFYNGSTRTPWFVSSVFGAILGLIATFFGWIIFSNIDPSTLSLKLLPVKSWLGLMMLAAGLMASLSIRSYFKCFGEQAVPTTVAIAITATPILVFSLELFLSDTDWSLLHIVSVTVTILGLAGLEYFTENYEVPRWNILPQLLGVLVFGAVYVVLIDQTLPAIENLLSIGTTEAALIAMPYYWVGFSIGIVSIAAKEVREFLQSVWKQKEFIILILVLEILGMSFFFFEIFGLAELNATLVSLIVGGNVILVWVLDQIIRQYYRHACAVDKKEVEICFFKIKTTDLKAYNKTNQEIILQVIFIALVLTGIVIWP